VRYSKKIQLLSCNSAVCVLYFAREINAFQIVGFIKEVTWSGDT